jgi:hypothetical protein
MIYTVHEQNAKKSMVRISTERQAHHVALRKALSRYQQISLIDFRTIVVEGYDTANEGKYGLTDTNILKALFVLETLKQISS